MLAEQQSKLAGAEILLALVMSAVLKQAIAESFVDGFRWVMLVAAGLASALIAALMIKGKRRRSRNTAMKKRPPCGGRFVFS